MRPLELGLIAGSLCLFFVVNAKDGGPDGMRFELRAESSAHARLALEVKRPGHRWRTDGPRPWTEIRGVTAEDLRRGGPVKFEIASDAGKVMAKGESNGYRAKGDFSFQVDPDFRAALQAAGYAPVTDEDAFNLMMHGVTRDFAKGVRAAGLDASLGDLCELASHGVKLDLINDARTLGFGKLLVRDFVEMRDHGVTPELLKAVKEAGYDADVHEIVEMRNHGVTPEYLKELAANKLKPAAHEVIEMRNHGVTPEYMARFAKAGYAKLEPREMIELRNHGVEADFAAKSREMGYGFTVRELIELRSHGVDARYLAKLHDSGFKNLSAEKIVKLKDHGID